MNKKGAAIIMRKFPWYTIMFDVDVLDKCSLIIVVERHSIEEVEKIK